ncbi:MAG: phosphoribosyltransferase, partial [Armatimonadota bacterium]
VAAAVADALGLALDVLVVRKVGVPGNTELAMGAVASGGGIVRNRAIQSACGVSDDEFDRAAKGAFDAVESRVARLRGVVPAIPLAGRAVLLVDDGMATGATAEVAVRCALTAGARCVVVAVPVAAREAIERLEAAGANVVCPLVPEPFLAVGNWYEDFGQISDDEVVACLHGGARQAALPVNARDGVAAI